MLKFVNSNFMNPDNPRSSEGEKKLTFEELQAYKGQVKKYAGNILETVKAQTASQNPEQNKFFSGSWYMLEGAGVSPFEVRFQAKGVGEKEFPSRENITLTELRQEHFFKERGKAKTGDKLSTKVFITVDGNGEGTYIKSESYLEEGGEVVYKDVETGKLSSNPDETKDPKNIVSKIQELSLGDQGFAKVKILG